MFFLFLFPIFFQQLRTHPRPSCFWAEVAAVLGAWAHWCYRDHLDEAAFGANDRPIVVKSVSLFFFFFFRFFTRLYMYPTCKSWVQKVRNSESGTAMSFHLLQLRFPVAVLLQHFNLGCWLEWDETVTEKLM